MYVKINYLKKINLMIEFGKSKGDNPPWLSYHLPLKFKLKDIKQVIKKYCAFVAFPCVKNFGIFF